MRARRTPEPAASAPPPVSIARSPIDRLSLSVATLFGIGHSPVAPGTMGSLAAIPIAALLSLTPNVVSLGVTVSMTPIAMLAAHRAGKQLGEPDSSAIVVDELVGMLMTLAALPWSLQTAALGFALFRLFDVLKPWPASHFDKRWKNGAGVVLDDVAAGLWARVVLGYVALS